MFLARKELTFRKRGRERGKVRWRLKTLKKPFLSLECADFASLMSLAAVLFRERASKSREEEAP